MIVDLSTLNDILATERKRIADRIRGMVVLRLEVGRDPLEQINDVLQVLADDVEMNWADYD